MKGQALIWSHRLEQEEFFKKKKRKKRHSVAVWGILRSSCPTSCTPIPADLERCAPDQPQQQGRVLRPSWQPGDGTHLTPLPRGTSHPAPVPRALKGNWLSRRKVETPRRGELQGSGSRWSPEDLTQWQGAGLASRAAESP